MAATTDRRLAGKRILVVEDDWFLEFVCRLKEARACVVGPIPDLEDAMRSPAIEKIDGAFLDIQLDDTRSFPMADILRQRHIQFVFASAFGNKAIPGGYADVPNVGKPIEIDAVAKALFGRTWASYRCCLLNQRSCS